MEDAGSVANGWARVTREQLVALVRMVELAPAEILADARAAVMGSPGGEGLSPGATVFAISRLDATDHGIPLVLVFADRVAHRLSTLDGTDIHRWVDETGTSMGLTQAELRSLCVRTGRALARTAELPTTPASSGGDRPPRPRAAEGPGASCRRGAVRFSGRAKLVVCRGIGLQWRDLADLLEVPAYLRTAFPAGYEAQSVWDWLDSRGRLDDLEPALRELDRHDLADHLRQPQSPEGHD